MNGKINIDGNLEIERAGKMKVQYCPHEPDSKANVACGDWCPLFATTRIDTRGFNDTICNKQLLAICENTILIFDTLTDERQQHE